VIVFLVRHAGAIGGGPGPAGGERQLDDAGREAALELGRRLRWHDCEPTTVLTSPAACARATAELVASALPWTGPVDVAPVLAPGAAVVPVQAALAERDPRGVVVVVGHEPLLSRLASALIGAPLAPLRPAEAVRIDDGELRWRFAHDDDAPVRTRARE